MGLDGVKTLNNIQLILLISYDDKKSNTGYLLDIDVSYPRELEKKHRDLPFLAEKRIKPTSNTRYSDPIQKARKNNPFFLATQIPKLLTILCDKDRYIAQMSTLSQALNHGLVLEKVHRVIKFKQEAWSKNRLIIILN